MLLDKDFDLLTEITDIEIIARGKGIRIRRYLNKTYGRGRWRKLKGRASIQLRNGDYCASRPLGGNNLPKS